MFKKGFYLFSFSKMLDCVFRLVYNETYVLIKCLYFVFILIILDTSSPELCL